MTKKTASHLGKEEIRHVLDALSEDQIAFYRNAFDHFDRRHQNHLTLSELSELLHSLGRPNDPEVVQATVKTIACEPNLQMVDFEQFLLITQLDLASASPLHVEPPVKPPFEPIRIFYFSDVLCIWAYIAQIRMDELASTFDGQISVEQYFLPVFGDVHRKLDRGWSSKGGLAGYNAHVRATVEKFNHVEVHPDIWMNPPRSSMSCHLFLRAIKLIEEEQTSNPSPKKELFTLAALRIRELFFKNNKDVSNRHVQMEITDELGIPTAQVEERINNGEAYADLARDFLLAREHGVTVSPTLIFNEGRQRLIGNVGYRVIEANIRELLINPEDRHSWC